jgi:hypothetical protein
MRKGLMILTFLFASGAIPVVAQTVEPDMALEMLSRAKAADAKCQALSPAEHDELSAYSARAELAAVRRLPVEEVQATVRLGAMHGSSIDCSGDTAKDIRSALEASQLAMAEANRAGESGSNLFRRARTSSPSLPAPAVPSSDLSRYGASAAGYYVELKCRYLSNHDARAFWTAIAETHRAVLATHKRAAVAATLSQAKARAEQLGCDRQSAQLVRMAFAALRQ